MKIFIQAKPQSGQEKVEKIDDMNYKVYVKEPPVKGKANRAILLALADYFKVPQNNVTIVMGSTSKNKVVEILET